MDRSKPSSRRRRLRVERLEQRDLLAVAAFAFELHADDAGQAGELLATDHVQVGEVFHVAILTREYLPMQAGLSGVSLDLSWDPQVFELAEEFDADQWVTDDLPLYQDGRHDAESGTIRDLRGLAAPAFGAGRTIGNLAAEQFAVIPFRALQATAGAELTMTQGLSGITTLATASFRNSQLDFESQTIVVDAGSTPQGAAGGEQLGPAVDEDSPLPADSGSGVPPFDEAPTADHEGVPFLQPAIAEAPVVEDPVVEDPVVEDPVSEDPIVEGPVEEEPYVGLEEPFVEEPIVIEQPPVIEVVGPTDVSSASLPAIVTDGALFCLALPFPALAPDTAVAHAASHEDADFLDSIGPTPPHNVPDETPDDAAVLDYLAQDDSQSHAERLAWEVDHVMEVFDSLSELLGPVQSQQFHQLIDVLADEWLRKRGIALWD